MAPFDSPLRLSDSLLTSSERSLPDNPASQEVLLDAEAEGDLTTERVTLPPTPTNESDAPGAPNESNDNYVHVSIDRSSDMDCDICKAVAGKEDALLCPTCVRNIINPMRIEYAKVLLDKEEWVKKVNHVVDPEHFPSPDEETALLAIAYQTKYLDELEKEQQRVREEDIREILAKKQQEVEELKAKVADLKANISQRRANLQKASKGLVSKKEQLEDTQKKEKQKKADGEALHNKTIESKAALCREVATLLNLKPVKRKTKDGSIKDCFFVAGLRLPDLREIHNIRCTELTAVLANTTFLLYICSFYIGIKLPAQMIVPCKDYPLATIMTPIQSYLGHDIPIPSSGSIQGGTFSSPLEIRAGGGTTVRPRPLFIGSNDPNESVAQFAKKDPSAFNFFLEGLSLLAYNVAWFSRSQGFIQGTDTWEEICDMGRILYDMILAPAPSPAAARVMSQRDLRDRRFAKSPAPVQPESANVPNGRLGAGSHTSMSDFYLRSPMSDATNNWHFSKYNMVYDPLKKHILNEMTNAEWELLAQDEWDDGGEKMDEAVVIKTRAMDGTTYDDARDITNKMGGLDVGAGEDVKGKGKSGWTKVKSRDKP